MMNFNKQFYKETFSKVEISQEMNEKLMNILKDNIKNTNKPVRRVATFLVAAVIVILSCVSVFAGMNLYNFYLKKDGNYAESLVLEKNKNQDDVLRLSKNAEVIQPQFVKINLNYLPDGFIKNKDSSENLVYNYYDNTGLYFEIIDVSDENKLTINNEYITKSDITTLNGNSVYYLEKQILNADDCMFDKEIYMYFSNYDYLVKCDAGKTVNKKILYKTFENLSLVECSESQAHSISKWSDMIYRDVLFNPSDHKNDYYTKDNYYIRVGDSQKIDDEEYNNVEVTVDNVVVSDDLSMMNDAFKSKYLDKNGKINPLEVKCYSGDGVNSLLKLADTKYIDLKYIYETVTYKNLSDSDINDFCVYHQIVSPPDNIYVAYDAFENKLEKKYETVEYDLNNDYKIGEWVYDSFSKSGTNSPNYIDIPANGEVTVNIGFFVAEETLKEDLWIDIYQGYSINSGTSAEKAILVDIPQ